MPNSIPYQLQNIEAYNKAYKQSIADPEKFWADIASHFMWHKPWDSVLQWNFTTPEVKWFEGAKLNITENCLDRHLNGAGQITALIWEPNNPTEGSITYTYFELHRAVCLAAAMLQANGVTKGDRVCIYMGMIPELVIAMLACARIGAIHSVIFAGFSATSIWHRVEDASAEFIITCDGTYRADKIIPLKSVVDEAIKGLEFIKKIFVVNRTGSPAQLKTGRDVYWHDEIKKAETGFDYLNSKAAIMDAEDPLFILYTSGSTGKPKGVVHTTAGYMVWANYTFVNVFQYQPGDVHFCSADIGWITGHSSILYGPLSAGAPTVVFEGVPNYPNASRFWDIITKHNVNIFYTAPTAIRSLMAIAADEPLRYPLKTLKVLGTVGEPINESAWHWYKKNVGKELVPLVDTWWQTENGGILISGFAGIHKELPGWATKPLPGVQPILVNEAGAEVTTTQGDGLQKGNLCIKFPWPGMLRTTWGNHERCRQNYFATHPGLYFTGDGALKDADGNYKITGRVDDVLNVSGHRIGTAEVENALNTHASVIESAVVAVPDDIKGESIFAFVIPEKRIENITQLKDEITNHVGYMIGAIAKPAYILFVPGLPKTRSGKIMRRILRKIAAGDLANLGDISTLLDPAIIETIIEGKKSQLG